MSDLATVRVGIQDGVPIAAIEGEVDLANSDEVRDLVLDAMTNATPGLVIDLTATTYLDSQGINILLDLARRLRSRQQRLRVVVPARSLVRRLLVLASLDDEFPLDHTIDEAVGYLRTSSG